VFGFHIVLVLSEDEFPRKEEELPNDLNTLANKNYIEILWVKENYKSLKKVLFTMDKYRNVPVISADDDCIYTCNYAEILYNVWLKTNADTVTVLPSTPWKHTCQQYGDCTLHAPYCYGPMGLIAVKRCAFEFLEEDGNDDHFMSALREVLHMNAYAIVRVLHIALHSWYNNASSITPYTNTTEDAYDRCERIIRRELSEFMKGC